MEEGQATSVSRCVKVKLAQTQETVEVRKTKYFADITENNIERDLLAVKQTIHWYIFQLEKALNKTVVLYSC